MGLSYATNAVTVNGLPAYRKGEYFRAEVGMDNSSSALWTNITVAATGQTSITGKVFLAQSPEQFIYDADGNLISDGRWTNHWDAENRLISMESLSNAPTGSKLRLEFAYDSQWRRIQKTVYTNNGSVYGPLYTNSFTYDSWNLLAELQPINSQPSTLIRSYTWGLDLSGSLQGAGGVGGLLFVNDQATISNLPSTHIACFDGNGNVSALVNAATDTRSAQVEYGPFGEYLRMTGPMANATPIRFSSKFQDDECDLTYYGYRYCSGSSGRWLSRDPILEAAFQYSYYSRSPEFEDTADDANEQVFVHNNALNATDFMGLCVMVQSGPGMQNGGVIHGILHHPPHGIPTSVGPVTLTFTITCPPLNPYLQYWGLTAAPTSPQNNNHPFPSGWSQVGTIGGFIGTYTITVTLPTTSVLTFDPGVRNVFVQGCCGDCSYLPTRVDPPAPPPGPWPPGPPWRPPGPTNPNWPPMGY
jgi:RHS repeat-associated protein